MWILGFPERYSSSAFTSINVMPFLAHLEARLSASEKPQAALAAGTNAVTLTIRPAVSARGETYATTSDSSIDYFYRPTLTESFCAYFYTSAFGTLPARGRGTYVGADRLSRALPLLDLHPLALSHIVVERVNQAWRVPIYYPSIPSRKKIKSCGRRSISFYFSRTDHRKTLPPSLLRLSRTRTEATAGPQFGTNTTQSCSALCNSSDRGAHRRSRHRTWHSEYCKQFVI